MDNNILKQWANLLLDTGKRNNLINFRDTKFSTVELVYPNYSILFDRINNNNSFEVFDPKSDDIDEYYFDNDIDEVETDDVKIHSKEEYVNHYKNKLRNNSQILIYNSFKKPFASLKNIMKKGKLVIEETGVNVIYIAFGFIHWKESEDSDIIFKSPILLKPVKIINKSLNDPFIISELENEVVVNPTFSFK